MPAEQKDGRVVNRERSHYKRRRLEKQNRGKRARDVIGLSPETSRRRAQDTLPEEYAN